MVTKEEYAQMALYVYQVKLEENRPLLPGWERLQYDPTGFFGFSYGVFRRIDSDEVVIAYTGTQTNQIGDVLNDLGAGIGIASTQTTNAAAVYINAKQLYGPNITFTGHSLGGGLASVMAVWFDRGATVFDEAPFELVARNPWFVLATKVALALRGLSDPAFTSYTGLLDFSVRENNVTNYYVEGEFLNSIRLPINTIVGQGKDNPLSANSVDIIGVGGAIELHSQALLTSMLLSNTFRQSTYASSRVIPLLLDKNLYAYDAATSDQQNLLVNLIRSEQSAATGQGKLAHLAADFQKLGANIAGLNIAAQDALIAQAIEWYYWQGADNAGQDFFTRTGELLQYTVDDAHNKAWRYIDKWLAPIVNAHGEFYTSSMSSESDQWNVVAGSSGVTATARDATKRQIFIGGSGADAFTGGQERDLMFAGDGADTLDGGGGDDRLYGGLGDDLLSGGNGDDRYLIQGHDTIEDTDGRGSITDINGRRLAGLIAKRNDGSYAFVSDASVTVSKDADLTLTLADGNSVVIKGYKSGDLGLQLSDTGATVPAPLTITGDILPEDTNPGKAGIQAAGDANGNPLGTAQPYSDILGGSAGNDHIQAGELDDDVGAGAGDDWVEGGSGKDWLRGDTGNDRIEGGTGSDILIGEAGNDRLYANGQMEIVAAIDAGTTDTASGQKGDWLTGNAGDDTLVAGADNDVLAGGAGADLLIAGAGDDHILGDADYTVQFLPESSPRYSLAGTDWYHSSGNTFNWTVTPGANPGDSTVFAPVVGETNPAGGGADVIYAGAGTDRVWAGAGDDYVDGGTGNDTISGEGGNDNLFGDAGNDTLVGDDAGQPLSAQGDDYLDGEDGDDTLVGVGGNDTLFGGAGTDQITGGQGNDYLDGEDGADTMIGDEGNDELFGGAGNDTLQGDTGNGTSEGNDYLDGEAGDDILLGLGGDDELIGGEGSDQIFGGEGADRLAGGTGNDTLSAEAGDDTAAGGEGNDLIDGGEGKDMLAGDAGQDQLQGGAGDDQLDGGADDDVLFGEAGNDTLLGGVGNDYLLGGEGDDVLDGGEGDDIYFAHYASGNDRIVDSGGNDTLVFNDIRFGQISISVGSLKLVLPDGGEVHLDDFDPDNPYAAGGIEWFQDADGVLLDKAGLIDMLGIAPTGTPQADVLSGTALSETIVALAGDDVVTARAGDDTIDAGDGADVVYGGDGNDTARGGSGDDVLLGEAGNDTLLGEAGNDLLAGGAGTDALQGGEGDDTYLFQLGDGQDTATDVLGVNGVVLGAGLTLDGIVLARTGNDLWVSAQSGSDRLTVKDWFAADSHFTTLTLGDGAVLDRAGVEAALPSNLAPLANPDVATVGEDGALLTIGNALANDSDPEGRALRITNPGTYAGTYGSLTLAASGAYSYSLANGSAAVQALASGQSETESFAYTVSDDDPALPASAASTITVTIHGANDAPVANDDFNENHEDSYFDSTGNVLYNDSDIDADTALEVLDSGFRVGAYGTLTLDAGGDYAYVLANDSLAVQSLAYGQFEVENFSYVASDGIAQVGGNLSIEIAGWNDAPVVVAPLADQTASIDGDWNWQLPTDSFTDIDAGDVLTYDALLADGSPLPAWLSFDAATQSFSGLVPADALDPLEIRVVARDSGWNEEGSLETSDVFSLSFVAKPANHAPVAVDDIALLAEDSQIVASGNVLANDSDVDAGTVLRVADPGTHAGTYGSLVLAADGGYSYSLNNAAAAIQSLGEDVLVFEHFGYVMTDGEIDAEATLEVAVRGTNDAPTLRSPLADQKATPGGNWSWQVPTASFGDVDAGDVLAYDATLADGTPLPAWLSFDPATRTFSGLTPADAAGTLDIRVTAQDGHGNNEVPSEASDVFALSFATDSGGGCGDGDHDHHGGHHGHGQHHGGQGGDHGNGHGYHGHGDDGHDRGHGRHDRDRDDGCGSGRDGDKPRTYLDPRLLTQYCGSDRHQDRSRGNTRDEAQTFARWLAADQAMSRLAADANRGAAWEDSARGADPGGLSRATGGMNGSRQAFGDDAITLMPGAALKGFKGLQEGVRRL